MYSFWGSSWGCFKVGMMKRRKSGQKKERGHEPITGVTLGQVRRNY